MLASGMGIAFLHNLHIAAFCPTLDILNSKCRQFTDVLRFLLKAFLLELPTLVSLSASTPEIQHLAAASPSLCTHALTLSMS